MNVFVFDKVAQNIFQNLILIFTTIFILIYFDSRLKIKIKINVSKFVIIVVLTQLILIFNKQKSNQ